MIPLFLIHFQSSEFQAQLKDPMMLSAVAQNKFILFELDLGSLKISLPSK